MAVPYERDVRLTNRQIVALSDLIVLRLEQMGEDTPPDVLRDARQHVSSQTPVDLRELIERLDSELMRRFEDWSRAHPEPDA